MSDASAFGFGKFIPGFDFLQNLAQSAGKAQQGGAPSWVAPTLSVEELDKRITDLKAVQFWLEQNVTTLKATIQAMEVQKMTLATLQGMNVNMADLAKAFAVKPEPAAAEAAPAQASAVQEPVPEPEVEETAPEEPKAKPARKTKAKADDKPMVDPMAWWGSLSQQFQNIAASAMKDVAAEAMKAKTSAEPAAAEPSPAASKSARKAAAKTATAKKTAPKKAAAKKPAARKAAK